MVEGPDKAGKTTLAQAIVNECGGTYYHFGVPPPNSAHVESCLQQLKSATDNTVFDRFGISAFAYDFCLRANPNRSDAMTTVKMLKKLIAEVHQRDHLWIYASVHESVLVERLKQEGDDNDYIVERELRHISHTYELVFDKLVDSRDVVYYDSSLNSVQDWVTRNKYQLENFLGKHKL